MRILKNLSTKKLNFENSEFKHAFFETWRLKKQFF